MTAQGIAGKTYDFSLKESGNLEKVEHATLRKESRLFLTVDNDDPGRYIDLKMYFK